MIKQIGKIKLINSRGGTVKVYKKLFNALNYLNKHKGEGFRVVQTFAVSIKEGNI